MRGVERGATRRAAVPPRSIRLERNPKTLTYSPGTMRRRRAPHSQRGGRRPRGDVSPTGRVFHTARSIKVGASQPSNRRPCHRIRRNLYEAVATRRTHSHAVIRQKFISTTAAVPRRRPRARTRRPRRARRRWHQPRRRRVVWPWRQVLHRSSPRHESRYEAIPRPVSHHHSRLRHTGLDKLQVSANATPLGEARSK